MSLMLESCDLRWASWGMPSLLSFEAELDSAIRRKCLLVAAVGKVKTKSEVCPGESTNRFNNASKATKQARRSDLPISPQQLVSRQLTLF